MTEWLPSALLALFSFGLWGLFSKLALGYIDAKSALVFQTLGVVVITVFTLYFFNFKSATNLGNLKGVGFGILTGIAYGIGCWFYLIAADKGKLVTVVTLTALYPLVTIFLSYLLLRENMNIKQCFGIALALVSIYLMSQ